MVSRQAAKTSSAAQDATSTPADSALAEVNAGPSSSFGSDTSDSSESEYARLTLEDLPPDASEEAPDSAGMPGEPEVGMDDGDQADENEAFGADMRLPCLQRTKRGGYSYHAHMYIHGLDFRTKSAHLAAAIDFHVVFMTIRERLPPQDSLDASSIESIFLEVSDEQGLHVERDMGIRVSLRLKASFFTDKRLQTTFLPFNMIQEVMGLWEQTQKKLSTCWIGKSLTPPVGHLFRTYDPDTLMEIWLAIRQGCIRFCGLKRLKGREEAYVGDWLDTQYAEQAPFRERQLEHWNTFHMNLEDPMNFEKEARRRRAPARQRERRAMAAEDKDTELTRSLNQECFLLERIKLCLQTWQRLDAASAKRRRREEAASAKRRRQEEAASAKRRRREVLLERAAQRFQRSQREERWRAMNRPDITVAEMMRGPAGAPQ